MVSLLHRATINKLTTCRLFSKWQLGNVIINCCFFGNKKVPVHMSYTSSETACLKLIFTKLACSMKKAPIRRTGTYSHKST